MTIGPLGTVAPPKLQFFLPGTATPAAGAKLFSYAGNTTTKQATYSDDNQTPNTNPIVLDANGECVCFVDTTLAYAFTFAPATDTDPPTNPYWTVPNMGFGQMLAGYAPLNSPALTGTPTAPTPTTGDSSGAIATTQFVAATLAAFVGSGVALTGTPTAPTAAAGTLTTQIATTAFVGAEIGKAWAMQALTASGSWTAPGPSGGSVNVKYRAWGSGGGGGGTGGITYSGGGSGGGGGYVEGIATVAVGTVLTITVGTGGNGGSSSSAGTAGSATTISGGGISVSAGGGGGGAAGISSGGAVAGGSGGAASGGVINLPGGVGGGGVSFGTDQGQSLISGSSFGSITSNAQSTYPGGGGGGGENTYLSGSAGSNGLVLLEWLAQ
jgi:hypothetical protein